MRVSRISRLRYDFYILSRVLLDRDDFCFLPAINEQGRNVSIRWAWFTFVFTEFNEFYGRVKPVDTESSAGVKSNGN